MDKSTFSILFIMQKGKPNAEGNAPIFARITINHQMTGYVLEFNINNIVYFSSL